MGSGANYLAGKFNEYVYFDDFNGIKIITKKGTDGKHDNTPWHSHTPNTMYAKRNKDGFVDQVSVYINNRKVKDIDTSGTHGGRFKEEDGHVHEYGENKQKIISREPNEEEKIIIQQIKEYNNGKK